MAQEDDLRLWAEREGLSEEVIQILQEQGFTCLDQIKDITSPDEIKELFLDSEHLNIVQYRALKRAVSKISGVQDSTTTRLPSHSPPSQLSVSSNTPAYEPPQHHLSARQSNRAVYGDGAGSPGATDINYITSRLGTTDIDREQVYRFLLLGRTGSGKSTTGNTILGEKMFKSTLSFSSVTSDCERKVAHRDGCKFEVMDCPGLYDTKKTAEEISTTIVKAVVGMHPGPHAILYVIPLTTRYTAEEFGTYQRLKSLFDEHITKHMIVLFTGGDLLKVENVSVEEHFSKPLPEELQLVLSECNNRRIVFDNKASDPRPQVERLLSMVRQMTADNGGQPYTCPMYAEIGQGLEEEVAKRLEKLEKENLKRMEYVKQLERETQQAEEKARKTQEQAMKNEQERKRQIEEKERERQRLQAEFSAKIKDIEDRTRKQAEEIQRLQKEGEHQERLMKEEKNEALKRERKKAAEEAERKRRHEKEMQDRLLQENERKAREMEKMHLQMQKDKLAYEQQAEEKRRQDERKIMEAFEEKEKALNKQREEERKADEERRQNHEREIENTKQEAVEKDPGSFKKAFNFLSKAALTVGATVAGGVVGGPVGAAAGFAGGSALSAAID